MSARHVKVKPATPLDFDGDHKMGRVLLNTCTIYLAICGDSFSNDQAHIYWALSFLKSGWAACFANRVLQTWNRDKPYYWDWDDFESDFTEQFCPKNEQLSALIKLEGSSWYQGNDLVEDYIDRFQELIDISEYSDNKTIVIKFRRGLDWEIQRRVALLGDSTLDFDDPKGWYKAAWKVAQNKEANDAFLETGKNQTRFFPHTTSLTPKVSTTLSQPFGPLKSTDFQLYNLPTHVFKTPVVPKDGPTPMEVDHAYG